MDAKLLRLTGHFGWGMRSKEVVGYRVYRCPPAGWCTVVEIVRIFEFSVLLREHEVGVARLAWPAAAQMSRMSRFAEWLRSHSFHNSADHEHSADNERPDSFLDGILLCWRRLCEAVRLILLERSLLFYATHTRKKRGHLAHLAITGKSRIDNRRIV